MFPIPEESDSSGKPVLYMSPLPESGNTHDKDELVPHKNMMPFPGTDESNINQTVHNSLDLLSMRMREMQQNPSLPPVVQSFLEQMEASDLQSP